MPVVVKGTQITSNQRQPAEMQWQNFNDMSTQRAQSLCAGVRACQAGGGNGSVKMEKVLRAVKKKKKKILLSPSSSLPFVCPSRKQIPGWNLMDRSHVHLMAIKK